jgi:hypothetical protein
VGVGCRRRPFKDARLSVSRCPRAGGGARETFLGGPVSVGD